MKRGFTLVELLAVIGILGILISLTAVTYNDSLKRARQQAYDRQVATIIGLGRDWSLKNSELLVKDEKTPTIVMLSRLINEGYVNNNKIIDPKTEEEMTGCVVITWNSTYQQYEYAYHDGKNQKCEGN